MAAFIENAYLQDYIEKDSNGTVNILNQFDGEYYGKESKPEFNPKTNGKIDLDKLVGYFNISTKLIIQRGYRIENGFKGKWTEDHAIEVRQAFNAVGLPEDGDVSPDENGLRYSIIGEREE